MPQRQAWCLALLLAIATANDRLGATEPPEGIVVGRQGMVVSVSAPASEVGVQVLREGGSAVDAAVAVALALAVTHPEAGNIGGGGFMLVHGGPGQTPVCIDYRETAPASASPQMFARDHDRFGHRVVGVPGTLRGLELAHKKFGRLPWRQLVEPAIRLAEKGFEMPPYLIESLNGILRQSEAFSELRRVYAPPRGQSAWQTGDRLLQPELAATLTVIAAEGSDAFYKGAIARQIEAEMVAGGGLIRAADLASYEAKLRPPVRGTFRGYEVFGPAPPSSGGVCLVQMLNVLEESSPGGLDPASAESWHLVIEAMRRAYRDRAAWLGDPDFVTVPERLISKEYAAELARGINRQEATPSADLAGEITLSAEGDSTTHFSVIDAQGMAVSNTYTLEQSYGSRVVVRGAGFLLNNEMGDFNWQPGHTDKRGTIGTPPNTIAPGKRMLSSQTPVIVLQEGQVRLITGSPGGRTIINTVLCVLLNSLEFQRDIRAAVDAPRWHQAWFPDEVQFERAGDPAFAELLAGLRAKGHQIPTGQRQGDAHSIWVDPATRDFWGAADHRRGGSASGW